MLSHLVYAVVGITCHQYTALCRKVRIGKIKACAYNAVGGQIGLLICLLRHLLITRHQYLRPLKLCNDLFFRQGKDRDDIHLRIGILF
ncbi:hypothetical protein SDC9_204235 [bioreactor metagenome]|uniref:Uncharacterized protein n=1 Tax=bioreactor metagenome TaxID=1076179 RepID=A0A645IYM3_9ZZZZ